VSDISFLEEAAAMTRKSEKISGPAREEATAILSNVLKRHRIRPSDKPAPTQEKSPVAASSLKAKNNPIKSEAALPQDAASRILPPHSVRPLDFEWCRTPEKAATRNVFRQDRLPRPSVRRKEGADKRQGEEFPEDRVFHYLIRLLECTVTIHCQISARTAAAARDQVEQIPNLIECREVSFEELTAM
jgi:hypothetical protein